MDKKNEKDVAGQGLATVAQVVKYLTADLNFISMYFAAMQPDVELAKFSKYLKPDSDVKPKDIQDACATAGRLPYVILTCPGLLEVIASHIIGAEENRLRHVLEKADKKEQIKDALKESHTRDQVQVDDIMKFKE